MTADEQPAISPDVLPGDIVTLRKRHPCGASDWEVTRVGADIGLRCLGCNRVVLLPRHEFRTKIRRIVRPPGTSSA
jgi:hypothetical protein